MDSLLEHNRIELMEKRSKKEIIKMASQPLLIFDLVEVMQLVKAIASDIAQA